MYPAHALECSAVFALRTQTLKDEQQASLKELTAGIFIYLCFTCTAAATFLPRKDLRIRCEPEKMRAAAWPSCSKGKHLRDEQPGFTSGFTGGDPSGMHLPRRKRPPKKSAHGHPPCRLHPLRKRTCSVQSQSSTYICRGIYLRINSRELLQEMSAQQGSLCTGSASRPAARDPTLSGLQSPVRFDYLRVNSRDEFEHSHAVERSLCTLGSGFGLSSALRYEASEHTITYGSTAGFT